MSPNARFTRPQGRFFSTRDEARRLDRALEAHQIVYGTTVEWWFHEEPDEHGTTGGTRLDDIYDEGFVELGKRYHGPLRVPVLSAVAAQGQEHADDTGFATYDRVVLRLAYEQARRAGLDLDLTANRDQRLHDRFVWRRLAFDVESIQTSGHFDPSNRDVTINIVGRQLRFDELYDAPEFQEYILPSGGPPPPPEDDRTPFPDDVLYPA